MDSAMLSSSFAPGEFGLPFLGSGFGKPEYWVGASQASQWETWLLKKGEVHKRKCCWAFKDANSLLALPAYSKAVPSCKKGRLQKGNTSMKWDLPLLAVPFQTWNRAPHQKSRIHFAVSLDQPKVFHTELIVSKRERKIRCLRIYRKKQAWFLIRVISSWLLDRSATRFNFPDQLKTGEWAHCLSKSTGFNNVTVIRSVLSHSTRHKTIQPKWGIHAFWTWFREALSHFSSINHLKQPLIMTNMKSVGNHII